MSDDDQTEASPEATTKRRAARVPGATRPASPETIDASAGDEAEVSGPVSRFNLPDFRHKSASYAERWFEENKDAPKRGVLTHDGWYVPPGAHQTNAAPAGR